MNAGRMAVRLISNPTFGDTAHVSARRHYSCDVTEPVVLYCMLLAVA